MRQLRPRKACSLAGPEHRYGMSYSVEVITPISVIPTPVVTVEELKLHLRLNNGTVEDDLLTRLVDTAVSKFQSRTGLVLQSSTLRQYVYSWDCRNLLGQSCRYVRYSIPLVKWPVVSVESLAYYDSDDTLITMPAEGYDVSLVTTPALLLLDTRLPALSRRKRPPIQIEFTAGYETIPPAIKQAILLYASHLYEQRQSHNTDDLREVPLGFASICDQYKTGMGNWSNLS